MMNTCTALFPFSSEVVGNLILDDSFEDGCSICLEPFSSLDPAFVTKCKHEYHLQCILDWSQRSIQCPVCLQHLVLNDPASQQMIAAAAEREKKLSQKQASYQENEANSLQHPNEADHEPLTTTRRVGAVRARIITRRRRRPSAPRDVPYCFDSSPSVPAPPPLHINRRSRSTEFAAISDSLKSKLSTASVRYRESLSKGTRSLKEKIMARNDSVKELSRGVQREMSAGIAGIARLIMRKRAGLCVPSGASHAPRVEDDSIVQRLFPTRGGMSSNPTNAVAQVA